MPSDKTKFIIRKLVSGDKLSEPEQEQLEDSLTRNSRVSKAIIWAGGIILTSALGVIGAKLGGLF